MVSGERCDPRIEKSFPQSRRDAERGTEAEPREGLGAATDSSNLSARRFGNTGGLPPRPRSADTPPNQGGELKNIQIIARYPSDPKAILLSGWALGAEKIAGKAALVQVNIGKGKIILFGFRPQYRGQSLATFPLLFNAISN